MSRRTSHAVLALITPALVAFGIAEPALAHKDPQAASAKKHKKHKRPVPVAPCGQGQYAVSGGKGTIDLTAFSQTACATALKVATSVPPGLIAPGVDPTTGMSPPLVYNALGFACQGTQITSNDSTWNCTSGAAKVAFTARV